MDRESQFRVHMLHGLKDFRIKVLYSLFARRAIFTKALCLGSVIFLDGNAEITVCTMENTILYKKILPITS